MTSLTFPGYGTITVSLNTVADLRTFDPLKIVNGLYAIVRGQTVIGDGLGGIFTFDNTSTATDDGITTIATTGLTVGRWVKTVRSITGAQGVQGVQGVQGPIGDVTTAASAARDAATAARDAAMSAKTDTLYRVPRRLTQRRGFPSRS